MQVCILTHTFPKYPDDTTAAFMHPLVMGIAAAGNRVTVLTPFHEELRINSFPYNIVTYKYVWPNRLHVLGYSQTLRNGTHFRLSTYLLAPLLVVSGIIALFRLTGKNTYDVICTHWIVPNGIIAAIVCAIRSIPFTMTLAGSDVYVAQKNSLFSLMARWAADRAAYICADSPQYLKELEVTGARIKKRLIIPYPVDMSAIRPNLRTDSIRQKLGIRRQAMILLSVGRLIEKKGFAVMLRALPAVIKKFPSLQYLIVGDGDSRTGLESLAVALGVRDNVHFVGSVARHDINTFYSAADVVVVPSIKDSQGNIDDRPVVLLEAMACSRAVVATRFPGNALTIDHGKNGLLVPSANPNALAQAVLQLLTSQSQRKRIGFHARQKVKTSFHYTIIGKRYHNLFGQITDPHGKHTASLE